MKHSGKKNNGQSASMHQSQELLSYVPKTWLGWIIPPCILALCTFLFYYPSLNYNFLFDDIANIKKLYAIRTGSLQTLFLGNPRWISYWLNAVIFSFVEFKPFLYRLCNLIFHISGGIFVFFILNNALHRRKEHSFFKRYAFYIALLTATLYLLHPVQTQTVSYVIQGQLEGLAGLSILMLTFFFLKLTQAKNYTLRTLYTIGLYTVALFSTGTKEIAIVSPCLLLLVDWFFVAQGSWHEMKKRWHIHAIVTCIIGTLYIYFLRPQFFANLFCLNIEAQNNIGNILTHDPQQKIRPLHFFISQFKVILHYIAIYIWPFNICVEYDWKLVKSFFSLDCLVPLTALLALGGIIIQMLRKDKINIIAFAALWFFIVIAPRSSIIPSSELLTDYKTYAASWAILFLLASALVKLGTLLHSYTLAHTIPQKTEYIQALCMLFIIPLGYATYQRNMVWSSGINFWANVIKNAPQKARAYNNYAVALSENQQFQEAIPFYKKAIQMDGKYPDPWNNLAVSYSILGQIDMAISAIQQSLKIQPYYPEGYNNLASFFIQKKQYAEADKMLDIALKLRKTYGKALFNKGKIYLEQNKPHEAFPFFKKACLEADLDNEQGFKIYAQISSQLKKIDDALFAFKKLIQYNPHEPEYYFGLANTLFMAERYREALPILEKTVQMTPRNERVWYTLAETYAKINNPQKALECFTKTQALNPSLVNARIGIARCHKDLGEPEKGTILLAELLRNPKLTGDLRKQVEEAHMSLQQKT